MSEVDAITDADRLRLERFYEPEPTSGCWLWLGSRDPAGYGHFHAQRRDWRAHRVGYELVHGPIPAGFHALHRCDTPACVNPAHMFLGRDRENMRDCVAKGRLASAAKTHCKNGHPLIPGNVYERKGDGEGRRNCRQCVSDRRRRRTLAEQARRAALAAEPDGTR